MKAKILELLYKFRTDISTAEMSVNFYSEYAIREEDFEELSKELEELLTKPE